MNPTWKKFKRDFLLMRTPAFARLTFTLLAVVSISACLPAGDPLAPVEETSVTTVPLTVVNNTKAMTIKSSTLAPSPSSRRTNRFVTFQGEKISHYKAVALGARDCSAANFEAAPELSIATAFSFVPVDGPNIVCAIGRNNAGNYQQAVTASDILIVDASGPGNLTFSSPAAPVTTSTRAFTFSFSAQDSITGVKGYSYWFYNSADCTGAALANGTGSSYTAQLSRGFNSLRIAAFDQIGNASDPLCSPAINMNGVILDVTSPASDGTIVQSAVPQPAQTVSGTCSENGRPVTVTMNSSTGQSSSAVTTCNTSSTPNWTASLDFTSLSDGAITVSASQTNGDGNSGAGIRSFFKSTNPPTVTKPANDTNSILSSSPSLVLEGSCSLDGQPVTINIGTPVAITTTTTCNLASNPKWSKTIDVGTLRDGTVTVVASQTNAAGDSAYAIRYATKATSPPSFAAAEGTSYMNSADLVGTCSLFGLPVQVKAEGSVTLTASPSCVGGTWSVTFDFSTLAESDVKLTASQTNAAGDVVTSIRNVKKQIPAPVLTQPANRLYPLDATNSNPPVIQGNTLTLTSTATVSLSSPSFTSCIYETIGLDPADPNYAASAPCSSLPSMSAGNPYSTAGGTATIAWTPTAAQRGTFKFTQTVSDGTKSTTGSFYVTVREPFSKTKLLAAFDATTADAATGLSSIPSEPRSTVNLNNNRTLTWLGLIGSTIGNLSSAGASDPWSGNGGSSTPYALGFFGAPGESMNLGSLLNGMTKVLFTAWISPISASSSDKVILSNSDEAGYGFTLKQGTSAKLELSGSGSTVNFSSAVLADGPTGYWRLGEASGTSATDSSGGGRTGTYTNVTLGTVGRSGDTAGTFNGTSSIVSFTTLSPTSGAITIEAWIKWNGTAQNSPIFKNGTTNGIGLWIDPAGKLSVITYGNSDWRTVGVIPANTWTHVAFTSDGSTQKTYINGALSDTKTSGYSAATGGGYIGRNATGSEAGYFPGVIDEVAIYNKVLTAAQIAAHVTPGVCRSVSSISNNLWTNVAAILDGSTAKLFINSAQECTINLTPSHNSTALTVGGLPSGSKNWSGKILNLNIYGSSDGSALDSNIPKINFDASVNRFRTTPVEPVVSSNLVLHLDAANAKGMLAPYTSGCASSDLNWSDLAALQTATLTGFPASCSSPVGWQGTGAADSPHFLGLDRLSGDRYVEVTNSTTLQNIQKDSDYSIEAWVRPNTAPPAGDSNTDQYGIIVKAGYHTGTTYTAGRNFTMTHWLTGNVAKGVSSARTFSPGVYHHVVAVVSKSGGTIKLYVNGTLEGTTTFTANTLGRDFGTVPWRIGVANPGATSYRWASDMRVPVARIYNKALSITEVKQNCSAQQGRFDSSKTTCAP